MAGELNTWWFVAPFALAAACTPLGDLDATGRGAARSTGAGSSGAGSSGVDASAGTTSSEASAGSLVGAGDHGGSAATDSPSGSTGGAPYADPPRAPDGHPPGGDPASAGSAPSQAGSGTAGSETAQGGGSNDPDAGSSAGTTGELTPDLPNDLAGSPVQGNVSCFEASYSGDASFEVRTPTASYVVLRNRGNIISITDELSSQRPQWIGYSEYRPRRVSGVLSDALPNVVTTLDAQSLTARHARLRSESATGDWLWVWDFYATQATLTILRAPKGFGFTYRGTPGGQLDDADRLVFASGQVNSVKNSFSAPLPGTTPWLYFADTVLGHSLFLIQHAEDALPDRYDSLDGDSAAWLFGEGTITHLPTRFSLGLVNSTNHAAVTKRTAFIIAAIQ
jgi:hypothetical protein